MQQRPGDNLDAIVVGGGVIGLACAWRAAQRGLPVAVLERERPGAGASGVAAGMLAPVGEATWGEDRLLELAAGLASALARLSPRSSPRQTPGATSATSTSAPCTSRSIATRRQSCGGASSS